MYSGGAVPSTTCLEITTSPTPSRLGRSNMVSSRILSIMERSPRAPVLRSIAFRAMAPSASSAKLRSILSISNSRWYCLTSAFFGSTRMRLSVGSSRSSRVASTGRRPTNSGIRPYFNRSSGSTSRKISPVLRSGHLGPETDRGCPTSGRDDLLKAAKSAAAYEQDVGGVDLQELLLGVLAAALRRHRGDGPFHDLEERLLHALARHVAGNRGVIGLATDLVDFVDIDDAALGSFDIVVGGLQQLENDVLHVLADIARLGQGRRVGHGKGHVEGAS